MKGQLFSSIVYCHSLIIICVSESSSQPSMRRRNKPPKPTPTQTHPMNWESKFWQSSRFYSIRIRLFKRILLDIVVVAAFDVACKAVCGIFLLTLRHKRAVRLLLTPSSTHSNNTQWRRRGFYIHTRTSIHPSIEQMMSTRRNSQSSSTENENPSLSGRYPNILYLLLLLLIVGFWTLKAHTHKHSKLCHIKSPCCVFTFY